ncbi:MAG: hypothetical protein KatS3mg003_0541 [Candidatus Nitrosocaldaceae archaeon]|nr:MAG: hypothetical protein KatS3mg003_0541 [Candidatus Nitrosocaldaceae archaeon]
MKIKIFVTDIYAGDIASRLKGYFILDEHKFKFNAVAFGRIGGHNINIKLSKKDEKMLEELGYEPEQVIIEAQRMMIEGDMEIIDKKG